MGKREDHYTIAHGLHINDEIIHMLVWDLYT